MFPQTIWKQGFGWLMLTVARTVRLVLVAGFVLAACGCSAQTGIMSAGGAPSPSSRHAAVPDPETAALLQRLTVLANSPGLEQQHELARLLAQAPTLDQLDEPNRRDRSRAADLMVAPIIKRLSTNSAPAAAQTLAALTRSGPFNASWQRQELLVRALATQRPLLPDCLTFLDAQSQPSSVNLHLAIETLCENGSEPAIALLGRKLADPRLDAVYKVGWMRGPILRQRRATNLLLGAERWIVPTLPGELRVALVEALFDYRPDEWYPGREDLPRPPAESATSTNAAAVLRRIAQKALGSDYPEPVQAAVRRTLAQLPASVGPASR